MGRTITFIPNVWPDTIRYEHDKEFNVDYKAECGQLSLAHVTGNKNK